MATRPSTLPAIDRNNTNRTAPTTDQQNDGFTTEVFQGAVANWIFGYAYDWLKFFNVDSQSLGDVMAGESARVSGLTYSGSGLTLNLAAGVAIVAGERIEVTAAMLSGAGDDSHTFTASKTTYVGVNKAGEITYSADLTLGTAPPAPPGGYVWFERVDTNATDATPQSSDHQLAGTLPEGEIKTRSLAITRGDQKIDKPRLDLVSDEVTTGRGEIGFYINAAYRGKLIGNEAGLVLERWDSSGYLGDALKISSEAADGNGIETAYVTTPEVDLGTGGTTETIDFRDGAIQRIELDQGTDFTLDSNAKDGSYVLILVQDGTGGHEPSWSTTIEGIAGITVDTNPNAKTVVPLLKAGSDWFAQSGGFFFSRGDIVQEVAGFGNDPTLAFPALATPGNLLVIACSSGGSTGSPTVSGFSLAESSVVGGDDGSWIYWREAVAGDVAFEVDHSDAIHVRMLEVKAGATPTLDETGAGQDSSSKSVTTTGAATTSGHPQFAIAVVGVETRFHLGTATTWSNGFEERVLTTGSQWSMALNGMALATRTISAPIDPDLTFSYTDGSNGSLTAAVATFTI